MQAIRSRDTAFELSVRRRLYASGLRYRVHYQPVVGLRRRADVVFTKQRIAVFLDGCFWHGCPEHGTAPTANSHWWQQKLAAKVARDRDTDRLLGEAGWSGLRVWEHVAVEDAADVVEQVLDR